MNGDGMNRLRKIRRKYISSDLPIRLCIFNLMSFIGIVGGMVFLITTFFMKSENTQSLSILVAVLFLCFLLHVANSMKKLKLAAILLCSLLGMILFPIMFLKGGGIYSGMPVWFMLVMVFDAVLIEGKSRFLLCGISILEYTGLVYYAYKFPEKISYFETTELVFMDVAQSIFFVGICIVLIISFQLHMYQMAYRNEEKATKEAEKAKEEAIAANAAKSKFLANMSHEIRTPMGVILGMNEMIQRECEKEEILEYSKDVSNAAKSLLAIINDILDFSKIESGKMNIVETEYDSMGLLKEIEEICKIKKKETKLDFEMKIDQNLPKIMYGDDLRIKQCLINLLSNAFKYTDEGKVTFEVTGDIKEKECELTFLVTDTGRGIKEEEREKLFDSFVRLDESHNRCIQGTGLGLNITSQLLLLMNSQLHVTSTFQKGSCFYFTISQKIVDATPIKDNVNEVEKDKQAKAYQPSIVAPEAKILVVDDNKVNLKVFCALLQKTKVQIETACNGFDAINLVREKKYDLIFLDHMMPEMDGEETFQKMKEEEILKETPVIMLTANAVSGMKEHFLEVGFDDFLSKPIEVQKLEEILLKNLK